MILLTGNTGYIGTVMTGMLREKGYSVLGIDTDWFKDNLFFPVQDKSIADKQLIKDVRDITEEDLAGVEAVIHLAGLSNDPLGALNSGLTDEINCKATVELAKKCKSLGIERFIFASSCSSYGIAGTDKAIDETGDLNPITAYAKAKVNSEILVSELADDNFHPLFMRNATVYGLSPKLRLDLVVNNLLAWAYLTGEVSIMSDGTPWRPIVHIEDFSAAFIAGLEAPLEIVHNQKFNVGIDSENYQVKDIAYEVQKAVSGSEVKILNQTGADERSYKVDFSKIKNNLTDFKPQWNVKKGIAQLLDAYKRYNLILDDFKGGKFFRINAVKALIEANRLDINLLRREQVENMKMLRDSVRTQN